MNTHERLNKLEKELLWESLAPCRELRGFMERYKEIRLDTAEVIRARGLFESHMEGLDAAISRLCAMGVDESASLKHVLGSLPGPFRAAVHEELIRLADLTSDEQQKATGRGYTEEG